jgi:hypothetical protein
MKQLLSARHTTFLKKSLRISLVLSLTVYAFLRMIFFELPFSVEDISWLVKVIAAGFAMTLVSGLIFFSLIAILKELKRFVLTPGYRQRNIVRRVIRKVSIPADFFEEQKYLLNEQIAA